MIKSSHKKNKSVAYSGSGVQTPLAQNYPESNAESKCVFTNYSGAFFEFLKMGGGAKDSTDSIQKKDYNFNYYPYSPKTGGQRQQSTNQVKKGKEEGSMITNYRNQGVLMGQSSRGGDTLNSGMKGSQKKQSKSSKGNGSQSRYKKGAPSSANTSQLQNNQNQNLNGSFNKGFIEFCHQATGPNQSGHSSLIGPGGQIINASNFVPMQERKGRAPNISSVTAVPSQRTSQERKGKSCHTAHVSPQQNRKQKKLSHPPSGNFGGSAVVGNHYTTHDQNSSSDSRSPAKNIHYKNYTKGQPTAQIAGNKIIKGSNSSTQHLNQSDLDGFGHKTFEEIMRDGSIKNYILANNPAGNNGGVVLSYQNQGNKPNQNSFHNNTQHTSVDQNHSYEIDQKVGKTNFQQLGGMKTKIQSNERANKSELVNKFYPKGSSTHNSAQGSSESVGAGAIGMNYRLNPNAQVMQINPSISSTGNTFENSFHNRQQDPNYKGKLINQGNNSGTGIEGIQKGSQSIHMNPSACMQNAQYILQNHQPIINYAPPHGAHQKSNSIMNQSEIISMMNQMNNQPGYGEKNGKHVRSTSDGQGLTSEQAKQIQQNNIFKKYLQHVKASTSNVPPSSQTQKKSTTQNAHKLDNSNRSKMNQSSGKQKSQECSPRKQSISPNTGNRQMEKYMKNIIDNIGRAGINNSMIPGTGYDLPPKNYSAGIEDVDRIPSSQAHNYDKRFQGISLQQQAAALAHQKLQKSAKSKSNSNSFISKSGVNSQHHSIDYDNNQHTQLNNLLATAQLALQKQGMGTNNVFDQSMAFQKDIISTGTKKKSNTKVAKGNQGLGSNSKYSASKASAAATYKPPGAGHKRTSSDNTTAGGVQKKALNKENNIQIYNENFGFNMSIPESQLRMLAMAQAQKKHQQQFYSEQTTPTKKNNAQQLMGSGAGPKSKAASKDHSSQQNKVLNVSIDLSQVLKNKSYYQQQSKGLVPNGIPAGHTNMKGSMSKKTTATHSKRTSYNTTPKRTPIHTGPQSKVGTPKKPRDKSSGMIAEGMQAAMAGQIQYNGLLVNPQVNIYNLKLQEGDEPKAYKCNIYNNNNSVQINHGEKIEMVDKKGNPNSRFDPKPQLVPQILETNSNNSAASEKVAQKLPISVIKQQQIPVNKQESQRSIGGSSASGERINPNKSSIRSSIEKEQSVNTFKAPSQSSGNYSNHHVSAHAAVVIQQQAPSKNRDLTPQISKKSSEDTVIQQRPSEDSLSQMMNQSNRMRNTNRGSALNPPPGTNESMLRSRQQQREFYYDQDRLDTNNIQETDPGLSPRSKDFHRIAKNIALNFRRHNDAPPSNSDFYRIGKMIGKGAFGKVNLAMHKISEQFVAIKSLNKTYLSEESQKRKVMQEVAIIKRLKHNHIVKLFDSLETPQHILFIMELCSGGDLLNYVRKRRKLNEEVGKYLFKQILEGLNYCHHKQILHRDIKLDNILLDGKGDVKIGDFGVSKLVRDGEKMTEQCGTPAYIAPEILKDQGYYGFKADAWSAGVVLYAMLIGTVPFKANNMSELHQMIITADYQIKEEISDDAKDLIKKLLCVDVTSRLSVGEALSHPWLRKVKETMDIFTESEKDIIKKEFTYNDARRLNRNYGEPDFTEHGLDSTVQDDDNNTTKSIILAPFNSTKSNLQAASFGQDVQDLMITKWRIMKFKGKVRELDKEYEKNNNGELDNGVYNKFVQNKQNEEAEQARKDIAAQDSLVEEFKKDQAELELILDDADLEKKMKEREEQKKDGKLEEIQGQDTIFVGNEKEDEDIFNIKQAINDLSNNQEDQAQNVTTEYRFGKFYSNISIDEDIMYRLEMFGYPTDYLKKVLIRADFNYATTGYYLLMEKKQRDNHHQELDESS